MPEPSRGVRPGDSLAARPDRGARSPTVLLLDQDNVPTLVDALGTAPPRTAAGRDRAVLTVLSGPKRGELLRVSDLGLNVGRSDFADVHLEDPTLSRRHARFFLRRGQAYVEDLGSTNGTYCGTERVTAPRRLKDGDYVRIGRDTVLRFGLMDALSEQALVALYEASLVDGLTEVHNRRYFDARLESEIAFASRHGLPLSILLMDIDEFKGVNDRFGHALGDAVLRVVAATTKRLIRGGDVLARYGGDEFVVLARELSPRNAQILAERIRRSVEQARLPAAAGGVRTTLSIGVATRLPGSTCDGPLLAALADRAMYRAKAEGRNRVIGVVAGAP